MVVDPIKRGRGYIVQRFVLMGDFDNCIVIYCLLLFERSATSIAEFNIDGMVLLPFKRQGTLKDSVTISQDDTPSPPLTAVRRAADRLHIEGLGGFAERPLYF